MQDRNRSDAEGIEKLSAALEAAKDYIRVLELRQKQLTEALTFYANEKSYQRYSGGPWLDQGKIARRALG
jgi:hypothetical protein